MAFREAYLHTTLSAVVSLASNRVREYIFISFLVETLPIMRRRYHSIFLSAVAFSMTVSVSRTESQTSICLATSYLDAVSRSLSSGPGYLTHALTGPNSLLTAANVHMQIRKSKSKLPALATYPLVTVSADAGTAPFRALVARLAAFGKSVGRMVLFHLYG